MRIKRRVEQIVRKYRTRDPFEMIKGMNVILVYYPLELAAISAYKAGDPDYQPSISQEEVLKELGLN